MNTTNKTFDFQRIEQAINYIRTHFKEQPSLDDIAAAVNLSPQHFQRLFSKWAGISPKKFLQYTTIEYAKEQLKEQKTLFDASIDSGLSSTSRLHDLFVTVEAMTPGEYKNQGKDLTIFYSYPDTIFGSACVASTNKGICYLAFGDTATTYKELVEMFPRANFIHQQQTIHLEAVAFIQSSANALKPLQLHIKGTDFQLKVWDALLKIPLGNLTTYGNISNHLSNPNANRAVGTAVGSNPVSFIIPCHRVIRSSGELGGYHWGLDLKVAMIGWEAAKGK
ncbi:MAG TPA: methylated-DNA--[protein]-cysteine S-methyltransferase [Dysgonamonadaceae bacterium]|nr:methylated-DNA--[protein]-cysteine S-methyltransferase [Dysgonamonadaceae bacterium]